MTMTIAARMKSLLKDPGQGYVLVTGLGVSGVSIARFLKSKGLDVVATDTNPLSSKVTEKLEALGVRCETGAHRACTFENAKLVVTSPGIPLDMEYFKRARAKGVLVTGELDLFSLFLTKPLVAITGTNGKTTVTTLVGEMLKASGLDVFTGGNIGIPLVEFLESGSRAHVVVAEVSSFQLDSANDFSPDVGVLLNIAEDHMDRYPDFDAYAESKWSLFKNMSPRAIAIVNRDITGLAERKKTLKPGILTFGREGAIGPGASIKGDSMVITTEASRHVIDLSSVKLKGSHNVENLAAAALAAFSAGGNIKGIQSVVKGFEGLPHRTQYAGAVEGVNYYNDSKGTNPHAVVAALKGFDRVILILGGRSKGTDFSCLIPVLKERGKAVLALGEAKEEIETALRGCCKIVKVDSMGEAVSVARTLAVKGDTVLLSPGCASFDMYQNYAQRGNDFMDHVKSLGGLEP